MPGSYNVIEKYRVETETTAPLHFGSSFGEQSEVLVHPVTGKPFLQASGIAGVLRSASVHVNGTEISEELFGRSLRGKSETEMGSRLNVSDGEFDLETVQMEYRPRVSIDPVSGTVSAGEISGSGQTSGHKFDIELVGQKAKLVFYLYLFHDQEDDLREKLEMVLAELKEEQLHFGGQRSNGAGGLKLLALKHHSFCMTDAEGRRGWVLEAEMDRDCPGKTVPVYDDIKDSLPKAERKMLAFTITLEGKTENGLLVKGIAPEGVGKDAADAENMKNAAGRYIVPGSSLKGTLRNRMTYIADYLGKKEMIPDIFGAAGKKESRGSRGILQVRDIVMSEDTSPFHQYRIHIDKFTGGVMNGALFSEKTVSGKVKAQISVEDSEMADAAAGLLILAIRDLSCGLINLGSGYSIGRGFIDADRVVIRSEQDGEEAAICFDGPGKGITDPGKLISRCLKAVQQWEA